MQYINEYSMQLIVHNIQLDVVNSKLFIVITMQFNINKKLLHEFLICSS